MSKIDKIFELIEVLNECPDASIKELMILCDVGERTMYRYLNSLESKGIVYKHGNGYFLRKGAISSAFEGVTRQEVNAIRKLLQIGIAHSNDEWAIGKAERFLGTFDKLYPRHRKLRRKISIYPEMKAGRGTGGKISIGHTSKPAIIDPIHTRDTISVSIINLMYSSLFTYGKDLKPVPVLARNWRLSDNGLNLKVWLRDDVKFHDGHPLTSHDVEYTYSLNNLDFIERIVTHNDRSLSFKFRHPMVDVRKGLTRPIAPAHLEGKSTDDGYTIGSGPFRLVEWTDEDVIRLRSNDLYFEDGKPHLQQVNFLPFEHSDDALHALQRGELDIALDVATPEIFGVGTFAFHVWPVYDGSMYVLFMNMKSPVFSSRGVRKAVDYGIDRTSIVNRQMGGYSQPCCGVFLPGSQASDPDILPTPYDPETSRLLLSDQNMQFVLGIQDGSIEIRKIAMVVKRQLSEVGLNASISMVKPQDGGYYDALLCKISAVEPELLLRRWQDDGLYAKFSNYESRRINAVLNDLMFCNSPDERNPVYHRADKLLRDDCPAAFLVSGRSLVAGRVALDDVVKSSPHFTENMKNWVIEEAEAPKVNMPLRGGMANN